MTNTPTSYRIWQSAESMLIQAGGDYIELSVADALELAAEINARLTPAPPLWVEPGVRARWTPALSAECVRLYVGERLGLRYISKRLGISEFAARSWLLKAGVTLRSVHPAAQNNLIRARAATAAKRAQRAA